MMLTDGMGGCDDVPLQASAGAAFARLMLGSVAERVLRTAPCPVVTVRDNSRAADAIADEIVAVRLS